MPEDKDIEIRSEEVQEILTHVPSWIIRWGSTLYFCLILLLIFISWFIKYPDVIEGKAILTTEQPPIKLVSKTGGYVEDIYFKDNAIVKKNATIAQITNPVRKSTIDSLSDILLNFNIKDTKNMLSKLTKLGTLGELQADYNQLTSNLKEYHQITSDEYYNNNIKNLNQQINYNKQLARITKKQLALLEKELENAKEKFHADQQLYEKGIISKNEFFNNQTAYTSKQEQFLNTEKNYVQYQIAVTNYNNQKNDLDKTYGDKIRVLETNITSAINSLISYIEAWQQNYTITAPITGQLSYLNTIVKNQFITAQEPLFAVIPNNQEYIANVQILANGYGKISLNQRVKIKLDGYPHQEYGELMGRVNHIAQLKGEEGYLVKVTLTKGLTTTYKKELKYKPNMTGSAKIITEDLRMLERIFIKFRKAIDN